jgi:glycerol-3-phosphate dehydrogenase
MRRDLERLASTTFDLLVIGGGVHGLAAAYDAAQRGLSVALVEQGDLGSGSSFNHLKTVHGGLRSLQSADVARFRESIRERHTLARIAPHLVEPLGFLLPTTRALTRSRMAFRAAFALDALLGADRNRDLPPRLHLPAGRVLSREECAAIDPGLGASGLNGRDITGGALWFDYQMPRAERLTLAFAHAAAAAGATLANYVSADRLLVDGAKQIIGVQVRDTIGDATAAARTSGISSPSGTSGATFDVRARSVLNAAGAGIGPLLASCGVRLEWPLQKAINLVTRRPMAPTPYGAIALASSHAGGTLIRVPWHGRTIVGTWHSESAAAGRTMAVSEADLAAVLADVNAAFPNLALTPEDVTLVHRGLVPAVAAPANAGRAATVKQQSQAAVLDHSADGVRGLFSIRGVKYTTGRLIAERAVDQIEQRLGRQPTPSRTARTALPGSVDTPPDALAREIRSAAPALTEVTADHLARSYGAGWRDVLALTRDTPSLTERIVPTHPAIAAEIIYAIRQEMAQTLTDIIVRRIQLGSSGYPGEIAAARAAALMQQECAWTAPRTAQERTALRDFYRPV